ncbi:MAG: CDP-glycerol glycerophosphotransferase family protein [Microthrixaceae bacterium]
MHQTERLLVPVTYGFSVRYLLPTGILDNLKDVCAPVVGLGWDDPQLTALLEERGHEVIRLPDPLLNHDYRMYRRRLALVHQRRLNSVTSTIQRQNPRDTQKSLKLRGIAGLRNAIDQLQVRRPGGMEAVEAAEPSMVRAGSNVSDFSEFLRANRIAAVLSVAPYHDQEGLLLWAARRSGIPSVTSVISFDNPTTRARWLERSDRVLVWNSFNADEVLRSYPDLTPDRVEVIGAPQFDLHRRPELVMDVARWRKGLEIDDGQPAILYGAGPSSLVPGEAKLVECIDKAISGGQLPGSPVLVVRRHPNDRPEPWHELGRRLKNSRVVDPWPPGSTAFQAWPSEEDLTNQMSSLAHSAVHVNVCSSMTLDGAMFDKPQVGPTFVPGADDETQRRIRTFYQQEHWLPIARSGGLTCAGDESELIAAIRDGLQNPDRLANQRREMISSVLTWDDGKSSRRLVDAVAQLGSMPR